MVELEVRCCCDAGKLLGYFQLREDQAQDGAVLRVPIAPVVSQSFCADDYQIRPAEQLILEVAHVYSWRDGQNYELLAVKSRDYPMEQLMRIRGFRTPTQREEVNHIQKALLRLALFEPTGYAYGRD